MGIARGPVRAAVAASALVVLAALAVTAGCGNPDRLSQPQRLGRSAAGSASPSGFRPDATGPTDQASCDPATDPVCFPTDQPTDTALPTGFGTDDTTGADQFGSGAGLCPATAPDNPAIVSAANRLSNGRLPAGVTVTNTQCSGAYLVADLTAPNLGTIQLVMRQDGTNWTGIAVGSYLCGSTALNGADAAKALLNC